MTRPRGTYWIVGALLVVAFAALLLVVFAPRNTGTVPSARPKVVTATPEPANAGGALCDWPSPALCHAAAERIFGRTVDTYLKGNPGRKWVACTPEGEIPVRYACRGGYRRADGGGVDISGLVRVADGRVIFR